MSEAATLADVLLGGGAPSMQGAAPSAETTMPTLAGQLTSAPPQAAPQATMQEATVALPGHWENQRRGKDGTFKKGWKS